MKKPLPFQRARSLEQVEQRREDILSAVEEILAREGVKGVTLMAISDRIGLSKSNIYRYFEGREDILVEVIAKQAHGLVQELDEAWRGLPQSNDLSVCAVVFAQACAARPLFCMLFSQMATTLEEGISVRRLAALKLEFAHLIGHAAAALTEAAPALGPERAETAVRLFLSQLAGQWPLANPGPRVRAALETPELALFRRDFRKTYIQACHIILLGLLQTTPA